MSVPQKVALVMGVIALLVVVDLSRSEGSDRPEADLKTVTDRTDYNWGWIEGHGLHGNPSRLEGETEAEYCQDFFKTYAYGTETQDGYYPNVDAYLAGCLDGAEGKSAVTGYEFGG